MLILPEFCVGPFSPASQAITGEIQGEILPWLAEEMVTHKKFLRCPPDYLHSRQLFGEGLICPVGCWVGRTYVQLLGYMFSIFAVVWDVVGCGDAGGQVNIQHMELLIGWIRKYCLQSGKKYFCFSRDPPSAKKTVARTYLGLYLPIL